MAKIRRKTEDYYMGMRDQYELVMSAIQSAINRSNGINELIENLQRDLQSIDPR